MYPSISDERQNRHVPGAFDGFRKLPLMHRTDTADAPRQNLAAFGNEMGEQLPVLEVDVADFLGAELADTLALDRKPLWSWHRIYDPFFCPLCPSQREFLFLVEAEAGSHKGWKRALLPANMKDFNLKTLI
jgi:hypothetical protein